MPPATRENPDDYEQTTARVWKTTRRRLNYLQMTREPGLGRKPSITELIWEAVLMLPEKKPAPKEGDKK